MTTFAERMARIEALVKSFDSVDEPVRIAAQELVAAVLELHREGLARLLPCLDPGAFDDDLVASLLVLHELHPASIASRVAKALGRAPFLHAELLEVRDGRVRVRVAEPTMRARVEEIVWEAAPDAADVAIEDTQGALILPIARQVGAR
jgi:hypothetical protein